MADEEEAAYVEPTSTLGKIWAWGKRTRSAASDAPKLTASDSHVNIGITRGMGHYSKIGPEIGRAHV